MVNPYDINGMKQTIVTAMRGRAEGARPADEGDAQDGRRARREGLGQRFLAVLAEAKPLHHKQLRPSRRA